MKNSVFFKIIAVIQIREGHTRSGSDNFSNTSLDDSRSSLSSSDSGISRNGSPFFSSLTSERHNGVNEFFLRLYPEAPQDRKDSSFIRYSIVKSVGPFLDRLLRPDLYDPLVSEIENLMTECKTGQLSADSFRFGLSLVFSGDSKGSKFVSALEKEISVLESEQKKIRFELFSMALYIVNHLSRLDESTSSPIALRNLPIIYRVLQMGITKIELFETDKHIPEAVRKQISRIKVAQFTAKLLNSADEGVFADSDDILAQYNETVCSIKEDSFLKLVKNITASREGLDRGLRSSDIHLDLAVDSSNTTSDSSGDVSRIDPEGLLAKARNFHERQFVLFPWCLELIKATRHPLLSATYDDATPMPEPLKNLYKMMTRLVFWVVGIDDVSDNVQSKPLMNLFMLIPLLTNSEGVVSSEGFDLNKLNSGKDLPVLMTREEFQEYLSRAQVSGAASIGLEQIQSWVTEDYPDFRQFFDLYVNSWFRSLDEYKQLVRDISADQGSFKTKAQERFQALGLQESFIEISPLEIDGKFKQSSWDALYQSLLRVLRSMVVSVDINKDYQNWIGPRKVNLIEKGLSENMLMTLYKVFEDQVLDLIGIHRDQQHKQIFARMFEAGESCGHRGNNLATLKRELREVDLSNPIIFMLAQCFDDFIEMVFEGDFKRFLIDPEARIDFGVVEALERVFSDQEFAQVRFFDLLNKMKELDERIFLKIATKISEQSSEDLDFSRQFAMQTSWEKMIDVVLDPRFSSIMQEVSDEVRAIYHDRKVLESVLDNIFLLENVQRGYVDYYSRLGKTMAGISGLSDTLVGYSSIKKELSEYSRGVAQLAAMYLIFKSDL